MISIAEYSKKATIASIFIVISGYFFTASAQNASLRSRVAVVANESKTNIWVSDFPKKTSVVITDNDNNLLSIISTNDFGAAYLTLPKSIKTEVVAKTLDGEIIVTNKAVIKNQPEEQTVVKDKNNDINKA